MNQLTNLKQWLDWLEANHPVTDIELGLSRVATVAKAMGLLSPKAPVITVAGTNGKGSIVATLEALALSHSLSVATYTSPHLIHFNERIKINGESISDTKLIEAFSTVAKAQEAIKLTYFEFTTLVGLYCFSKEQLDLIVLEVGLGGRLDAVNIVDADLAIISSISLDHTDWLGTDLKGIAQEKAGIMRKNTPVILAEESIEELIESTLLEIQPKVICQKRDYQFFENDNSWDFQFNDLKFQGLPYGHLYLPNQAAALTGFSSLFPQLFTTAAIDKNLVKDALKKAYLTGRFQKINALPLIYLDVAHNPASAMVLNANIKKLNLHISTNVWGLCGMLKDKDIASTLAHMTTVDRWLLVDLEGSRGSQSDDIAYELNMLMDQGKLNANPISTFESVDYAMEYLQSQANDNDLITVFGSFVTVGQMIEYWQGIKCFNAKGKL